MRRLAFLIPLLAASQALRAEEAETPFLIFREADPATAKRIERDLVTEKQLGGMVPAARRQTREELARIGPWSVPFLSTALRKESSARIRLNAVIALVLIRDPRGLPALRAAAREDKDIYVQRAATLAIGTFECKDDFKTLRDLADAPHAEWRSLAPALARLRHRDASAILEEAAKRLQQLDDHEAAAILIAAAIAAPDVPLLPHLEKGEKLLQEAAAAGLAIRPLPTSRASEILAALKRTKGQARVLAIRAMGAIAPRAPEVEAELLEIACGDGTADERIAAMLELEGRAEEYGRLANAYRNVAERNDPVAAALLFALARTGEEKAIQTLRAVVARGSDFLKFYAGASLLYANGAARLEDPIRGEVAALGGELQLLAQRMGGSKAGEAAFAELRAIEDPKNLRLFVAREERNWNEVNRLLARIFKLGVVLNQFDSSRVGRTTESAVGGGSGGEEARKAPSGSDQDQDLFDLLIPSEVAPPEGQPPYPERTPYFGPGDFRAG